MSLDELNRYYRYLRKYEFENNKPLESSELKKRIHKLTMLVLKIDRFFSRRKLEIFDDKLVVEGTDVSKINTYEDLERYVSLVTEVSERVEMEVDNDWGEDSCDNDCTEDFCGPCYCAN